MFVAERRTQRQCEPVGLDAALDVLQFAVILLEFRGDLPRIIRVVVAGQPFGFELFTGVHQVVARQVGGVDREVAAVADVQASGRQGFGRDDDHAVGGARTVHGRCRGVFQDGVGLDALDVEVVDLLHRHLVAVEHEDRLIGVVLECVFRGKVRVELEGADTRLSADIHLRQGIGVRTHVEVLGDAERGLEDLDGAEGVALRSHGLELFAGDRGRRSGERLLGDVQNTGNHDVADLAHFGVHVDVDFIQLLDMLLAVAEGGDRLTLHAQK